MIRRELKEFPELTPPVCGVEDALKELNINVAIAQQWYNNSYLSFKIEEIQELDESAYNELLFLNTMFNSEIPLKTIDILLAKLEKPYDYKLEEIYFDFIENDWNNIIEKDEYRLSNINDIKENIEEIVGHETSLFGGSFKFEENIKDAKEIIIELEGFIKYNEKQIEDRDTMY